MPQANEKQRVGLILAGGRGLRMSGADKGALALGGARMIDRIAARMSPQVDKLLVSGCHNYGLGLTCVADRTDGPAGPAAGLWAVLRWIAETRVDATGVLTAPADGPFVPLNLADKLVGNESSAVACDERGMHPTFAWWRVDDLERLFASADFGAAPSLKALCATVNARRITFEDPGAFFNVNTPNDLAEAERRLSSR